MNLHVFDWPDDIALWCSNSWASFKFFARKPCVSSLLKHSVRTSTASTEWYHSNEWVAVLFYAVLMSVWTWSVWGPWVQAWPPNACLQASRSPHWSCPFMKTHRGLWMTLSLSAHLGLTAFGEPTTAVTANTASGVTGARKVVRIVTETSSFSQPLDMVLPWSEVQ